MEPKTLSVIVKETPKYSKPCKTVNKTAIVIVVTAPQFAHCINRSTNEWCTTVTAEPEDNNKVVFAVGTSEASTGSIPFGGHSEPISTVGANEEWK